MRPKSTDGRRRGILDRCSHDLRYRREPSADLETKARTAVLIAFTAAAVNRESKMMATTRLLIVLYVLVSLHSTFSFSLAPARCVHPTSTCLFSEEESSAGEAPAEEAAAAMNNEAPVIATDILNSPAFLQRKLQVLQSDIAQMDADAEAARQQLEEGKAEWGSQLEALQTEVSRLEWHARCRAHHRDRASRAISHSVVCSLFFRDSIKTFKNA
jgi:hypothetical protein